MTITGTGTEQDPYIVHSYDEIKTACQGNGVYVELANDIDCNDYGENFVWEAIQGSGAYYPYYLDLKGHTIKNFKVNDNDYAFKLTGDNSCVKNGKILNCYLSDTLGFCCRTSSQGRLENLSISTNVSRGLASGDYRSVFGEYCYIDRCAIYVEGTVGAGSYNAIFKAPNTDNPIKNTDILVHIEDSLGLLADANNSYDKVFSRCRIRGLYNLASGNPYNYVFTAGLDNCVIDLESNYSGNLSQYVQNCTGVINTDKLSNYTSTSGMTAVTSQEIINGDALRAKGFDVINIVA